MTIYRTVNIVLTMFVEIVHLQIVYF